LNKTPRLPVAVRFCFKCGAGRNYFNFQ